MSTFQTILLGVAAGVITAISLFLFKEFWLKSILPFYQKVKYQGADISGAWEKEYEADNGESKSSFSITLSQNAHKIKGTMDFVNIKGDKKVHGNFNLTGEYWEGYLTLNARTTDRKKFSSGTMFLKLTNNGKNLDGYFCFRDAASDVVTSKKLELNRN